MQAVYNMNVQKRDESVGHHYGNEYECNPCDDCNGTVVKGITTVATILMVFLLCIIIILGVTGHSITITIGDYVPTFDGLSPFARPSTFPHNNFDGYDIENDLFFVPLLDHERNSTVTSEEDAILRSVFSDYDDDDDGLWSYSDFTNFVEDTMRADASFALMDSKTNDGYLDYDELVLIFTVFESFLTLHEDEINKVLVEVTGLPLKEAKAQEPEVLASLIYEVVGHGEDGISEKEWFDYMVAYQWEQFNEDKDSFVDFAEFERDFFESDMFLAFQQCSHEVEGTDPQSAVQAFKDTPIVHHSRRRLINEDLIGMGVGAVGMGVGGFGLLVGVPLGIVTVPVSGAIMAVAGAITLGSFLGGVVGRAIRDRGGGCYDDMSFVSVRREGGFADVIRIKDVNVGDYVYDGDDFTKVCLFAVHGLIR